MDTRLVQVGTVTDVDPRTRKARVKHANTGIISDWLVILQHQGAGVSITSEAKIDSSVLGYWIPKVNDKVLVLYLPMRDGDGYILGGI